jgi:hypothetical protein
VVGRWGGVACNKQAQLWQASSKNLVKQSSKADIRSLKGRDLSQKGLPLVLRFKQMVYCFNFSLK